MLRKKVELLDTPGVLWPKFESEEVALHLCFTGSIKEEILDKIEIAYQLTKFLLENYRTKLCDRYKIDEKFIEQTLIENALFLDGSSRLQGKRHRDSLPI